MTDEDKYMLDKVNYWTKEEVGCYNKALDEAIEVVKVEYAKSGFGIQSPISSPLQGTSRGALVQKIISKLESIKKKP